MAAMEQIAGMALQQTLSPQMQQSLNILQAPLAELREMVDTELRENPALEEAPPANPTTGKESSPSGLEEQWTEYYSQRASSEPWTREAEERRQHFFDSQVRPLTLHDHLLAQAASWREPEAGIAAEIIGNIDDLGYLRSGVEEMAEAVGAPVQEVARVLGRVQEFDPAGIAARNLSECLLLQLKRQGLQGSTEARIVKNHLEELGRKKLNEIAKALDLPLDEIQKSRERSLAWTRSRAAHFLRSPSKS